MDFRARRAAAAGGGATGACSRAWRRHPKFFAFSLLALVAIFVLLGLDEEGHALEDDVLVISRDKSFPVEGVPQLTFALKPTHALVHGVESWWALPPTPVLKHGDGEEDAAGKEAERQYRPRAVAVLLHGCNHGGEDFFVMPEEKRLVRHLLSHDYAVVAFSSQDRSTTKCWDVSWPPHGNLDVLSVRKALPTVLSRMNLLTGNVPLVAIGASSGGSFATVLSRTVRFSAIAVQISPGVRRAFTTPPNEPDMPPLPPVAFVYMPRDKGWASRSAIEQSRALVEQVGVQSITFECLPHPLTPTYLSDRIDTVTPPVSAQFYELAHMFGFLDPHGMLLRDPRRSGLLSHVATYMEHVREQANKKGNGSEAATAAVAALSHDESLAIDEELNVLYGKHEITSEYMPDVLRWFNERLLVRTPPR